MGLYFFVWHSSKHCLGLDLHRGADLTCTAISPSRATAQVPSSMLAFQLSQLRLMAVLMDQHA